MHEDVDDAGQSVELVEPPAETPPAKDKPEPGLPQTGDGVPLIPLASLLGAAAAAALAVCLCRRREGTSDREGRDAEGTARTARRRVARWRSRCMFWASSPLSWRSSDTPA